MSSIGSVTLLLDRLKAGGDDAARQLWEAYFHRLVGLARRQLQGVPRRAADEEDVALSAFDSFCRAAEAGRFPRLDDRDDLWRLLLHITGRKALDLREHESRQKRGGGRVHNLSAVTGDEAGPLDVPAAGPDPAEAAQLGDECRRLLALLDSTELTRVAVWKLEGHTNAEIARLLGKAENTVERKLQLIRRIWQDELSPPP